MNDIETAITKLLRETAELQDLLYKINLLADRTLTLSHECIKKLKEIQLEANCEVAGESLLVKWLEVK